MLNKFLCVKILMLVFTFTNLVNNVQANEKVNLDTINSGIVNPANQIIKVKELFERYQAAIRESNSASLNEIFNANAMITNNTGQKTRVDRLDAFNSVLSAMPAAKNYKLTLSNVDIVGTIAIAKVIENTAERQPYISKFHLLNVAGQWQIVSKNTFVSPAVSMESEKNSKQADIKAVNAVMENYELGTRTRDIPLLKEQFHPNAIMSGYIGRHLVISSPQPFFDFLWANSIAPDYDGETSNVTILGNTASARIVEKNLFNMSFVNEFQLVKSDDKWRIVSKLFQHGKAKASSFGSAFRRITNNKYEASGVSIYGWLEASALLNNNSSRNVSPQAFFNTEEGLNLNQIGLTLCKGDGCLPAYAPDGNNVISRVTPTPGPKGDEVRLGYNVTFLYGEDVGFFRTSGLDDNDFGDVLDHKSVFAIPQAYLDIYVPFIGDGTSFLIGSFQTSIGNQIGYPFTPPNWFVTRQNSFVAGPAKHVGILAQTKLPIDLSNGLLSIDYGITLGWNNFDNKNDDFSYMLGARWRSSDMRTWVDLETIFGNGENDFGDGPGKGGSPYFALSSTGESLNRFHGVLTATHQATDNLAFAVEATYGSQEGGDIQPLPFFILDDSRWYGISLASRYNLSPKLSVSGRVEWFKDENGANVLYSGSPGAISAVTGNIDYQFLPNVRLRSEIRFDTYHGDGIPLYGDRNEGSQLVGILNAVVSF